MARLQPDSGSDAAQDQPAGPPSSNKSFRQRYTVVEHHPSGSSTVSQSSKAALGSHDNSDSIARQISDSDRFTKNSQQMELRATNDFRDTLRWVSTMSGGPVDRRLLREAVSFSYISCKHKPANTFECYTKEVEVVLGLLVQHSIQMYLLACISQL